MSKLPKTISSDPSYGFLELTKEIRKFVHNHNPSTHDLGWVKEIPTNGFLYADLVVTGMTTYAYLQSIGLSNGWRQAFSYDPSTNDWRDVDCPIYTISNASEFVESGEILGPWIIDDLQIALASMKHYLNTVYDLSWSVSNATEYVLFSGSHNNSLTWAEAQAAAETNTIYSLSSANRRMFTSGYQFSSPKRYVTSFSAERGMLRYNMDIEPGVKILGGSISWFARAEKPNGEHQAFDDNGIAVYDGHDGVFSTTTINAGTTNTYSYSDWLGSLVIPQWCDDPVTNGSFDLNIKGYSVKASSEGAIISPNFSYTR